MFCIRVSNGVSGKHHSIGIGLEEPGSKKIRVTVTMRDRCYKKITLQVVSGIFVYTSCRLGICQKKTELLRSSDFFLKIF